MPPEAAPQIKGMIQQVKQTDDLGMLQRRLQMMEPALTSGQIPEERKAMFEYMIKIIKARVAELEAAQKESE